MRPEKTMYADATAGDLAQHKGGLLTSVKGQKNLPRYFARVMRIVQTLQVGSLILVLPDGRKFIAHGQPGVSPISKQALHAELYVYNTAFFSRLVREGDLGFADSYLDGWWSTPDLQALMDLFHAGNERLYDGFPGLGLLRLFENLIYWLHSNTRRQAMKNISYHYDLGNEFYGLWLDETMTYSSALFQSGDQSMASAQTAKYAAMIDQMGVEPGDHVLEIGCGWGGFAVYAAQNRGLRVTGLTISKEQLAYAEDRVQRLNLGHLVNLKLQDYRDEQGVYDGVASIEMFEAVGEKYWPQYFEIVRRALKPGARATLQIIMVQDKRFDVYRKSVDFIQKYIFPGGMLPSPSVLQSQITKAGLTKTASVEFGRSYSQTLRQWHDRFNARWDEVAQLGFDDRFRRMWNMYLTSCASAFESGYCDVTQITMKKPN
jgi:cyclopropane-fatty-acyl-phospholipid synthase